MATTPVPSDFNGLHRVKGYLRIFHQNDSKEYKRDYLDAQGQFALRFGAIGEKPLGVGNTPLWKTRVNLPPGHFLGLFEGKSL